jgi:hypothetical protein
MSWFNEKEWPKIDRGFYIGTIIDPSAIEGSDGGYFVTKEYEDILKYNLMYEPQFISVEEEYINKPIKVDFSGWRRHFVYTE